MKYFVKNSERESTCYHEFYKGKWDEKTFWKEDSLLLHDDVMFKNQGFVDAVMEVIPTYDPFGETEISPKIWKKIGQVIKEKDERAKELYDKFRYTEQTHNFKFGELRKSGFVKEDYVCVFGK